jgi:hypothetical protein
MDDKENVKALVEELENIIESHNQEFIRYLLVIAQIMDLLPIPFTWKQDILYALLLQGEIIELEKVNRCLNSHYNDKVERI